MDVEALRFDSVCYTYPGQKRRAIDQFSLTVRKGEILALLGPNGSGKSTLLNLLVAHRPPEHGAILILGIDPTTHREQAVRQLGFVAQQNCLDPYSTARQNLSFQARLQDVRFDPADPVTGSWIDELGLNEYLDSMAMKLSGGQQRRVAIAMGLVHGPSILVLDEPATGLDPEVRYDLWRALRRINASGGVTILFSTHDLDEVELHAQSMAVIDSGVNRCHGPLADLKARLGAWVVGIDGTLASIDMNELQQAIVSACDGRKPFFQDASTLRVAIDDGADIANVRRNVFNLAERSAYGGLRVTWNRPSAEDVYLSAVNAN